MTWEEAKEFYFRYEGHAFHMDREDSAGYEAFRRLAPGRDLLKRWDEELLEGLLRAGGRPFWSRHERALQILRRGLCDPALWGGRLADVLEQEEPDPHEAALLLENMAGRSESMTDGGVYILRECPAVLTRTDRALSRLTEGAAGEPDERLERAIRRYRAAYKKWGPSPR